MRLEPESRVVLTGAAGGIGQALAERLIGMDAQLLMLGRNPETLEVLAQRLGPRARTGPLDLVDVASLDAVPGLVEQRLGSIDMLIHCAGQSEFGPFDQLDASRIQSLIGTNLLGPIRLTQVLLPMLLRSSQPRLVLIGSALGWLGYPGHAVYSASKAGLRRFGEALRREYARQGLQVIHVAPRATRTPFNGAVQQRLNERLKVHSDSAERVAERVLRAIERNRAETVIGFPEALVCRLNQLAPALLDRTLSGHAELMRKLSAERIPASRPLSRDGADQPSQPAIATQPKDHP